MKLFNFHIVSDKNLKKFNEDVERQITDEKYTNNRPSMDPTKAISGDIIKIPYYPLPMATLFDIALYSDTIKIIYNPDSENLRYT